MHKHRGTIFLADAEILDHQSFPGDQYILRVRAPEAAAMAQPGSFAHLRCDSAVPMRRPLSIMRADPDAGWLEFLYKPVGIGLAKLALRQVGESLSVLAPIGNSFSCARERARVIAIGGGVGIPPMIFLAERLSAIDAFQPVVLMGSEVPFPFELSLASTSSAVLPGTETASLSLLDEWDVPSRLASNAGLSGTFRGVVTELARELLEPLAPAELDHCQIVGCGPEPMLRATAALAAEFGVPCRLALEEFMACGVGGCAGCTVLVHRSDGTAMKRVCVDGPVFDATEIYPGA